MPLLFVKERVADDNEEEAENIASDLRGLYVDQAIYEPDSRRRKSNYLSFLNAKTSNRNSR